MKIIVHADAEGAARAGARIVAEVVRRKPNAVLGLATGHTPLELYGELIRMHREEGLDFSRVTTFNLDEYRDLPPGHPASYHAYMEKNLFRHINVPGQNIHIPDGRAEDVPAFCEVFEESIRKAGGVDLQILGVGTNGHIGFNEPSSDFRSRTHLARLTESTRRDNAFAFENSETTPPHAITMGLGTIMDSRSILFLALGERKAQIVADAVEGPVTEMVPASVLQGHPDVTVILDEPAASRLRRVARV